jgi:hypothetical protein
MRWVKLTSTHGGEIYVNMGLVTEVRPSANGGSLIYYDGSTSNYTTVCETCEEIMRCL